MRQHPVRHAKVAELADAQASGACSRKGVEVRVLSFAPFDSVAMLPRSWQAESNALSERSESKGLPRARLTSSRRE